jgi:hypothetical protein
LLRFGAGEREDAEDVGDGSVARLVDSIVSPDEMDGCDGGGCPAEVT